MPRSSDNHWEETAYTADRASSLAGVPKSTIHYWDRTRLVIPSVSPERVKLWSFSDLMKLRAVQWLRNSKRDGDGQEIAATPTPAIRRALLRLDELGHALWDQESGYQIRVNYSGEVYLDAAPASQTTAGQLDMHDEVDLIAPFNVEGGIVGPNLLRPRPHLRIIPGKLAGAPHVEQTRLETQVIYALADRGMDRDAIFECYPFVSQESIQEAIELEEQLIQNLHAA